MSITGHGRTGAGRDRVAFGDDAAVAGALVVADEAGPCFCADAAADPAAGVAAAAACLDALAVGGRWVLDVAMADVAASLAGPTLVADAPATDHAAGPDVAPLGRARSVPRARRWASTRSRCSMASASRRESPYASPLMAELLFREVTVEGRLVDVRASDGTIAAVGPRLKPRPARRSSTGAGVHWSPGSTTTTSTCWRWPPPSDPFAVGPAVTPDAAAFAGALRRRRPVAGDGRSGCAPSATTSRSPDRSTAGGSTRSSATGPCGCSTGRAASGCSTRGAWR